jgi:hypothetical protein
MNICVDGNNDFHTGWLAKFLGLPKKHPRLDGERAKAFSDGWDTCLETEILEARESGKWSAFPGVVGAFREMVKRGQASVIWVDDNNNEIDDNGELV